MNETIGFLEEKPDLTRKIDDIMNRVACKKHNVPQGVPCFHIPRNRPGYYAGLCGTRVRKVFNGVSRRSSFSSNKKEKK
jgi:hypothetical protein